MYNQFIIDFIYTVAKICLSVDILDRFYNLKYDDLYDYFYSGDFIYEYDIDNIWEISILCFPKKDLKKIESNYTGNINDYVSFRQRIETVLFKIYKLNGIDCIVKDNEHELEKIFKVKKNKPKKDSNFFDNLYNYKYISKYPSIQKAAILCAKLEHIYTGNMDYKYYKDFGQKSGSIEISEYEIKNIIPLFKNQKQYNPYDPTIRTVYKPIFKHDFNNLVNISIDKLFSNIQFINSSNVILLPLIKNGKLYTMYIYDEYNNKIAINKINIPYSNKNDLLRKISNLKQPVGILTYDHYKYNIINIFFDIVNCIIVLNNCKELNFNNNFVYRSFSKYIECENNLFKTIDQILIDELHCLVELEKESKILFMSCVPLYFFELINKKNIMNIFDFDYNLENTSGINDYYNKIQLSIFAFEIAYILHLLPKEYEYY